MSRVLVLSPHPDDESIGCGGTLRKHVVEGDEVRVVFLTSGEAGGPKHLDRRETARVREAEARRAAEVLGIAEVEFWREPDGGLSPSDAVVARLRDLIASWLPETLYVTHSREMHADHRAAARVVRRALGGYPERLPRPAAWGFEVWTPIQRLHRIVDISPHVEAKLAAIRAYVSQGDLVAFDDAALALNRYRGELHSWPGGDFAEVFTRVLP
jgi:N-acetylglucosamine malate deacetylase 1